MAYNLQDALELSGGYGRFQFILSLICMGSEFRSAATNFPLPLLELAPKYECLDSDSNTWYRCVPVEFCANQSIEHRVDYDHVESLDNWFEKLDLACASPQTVGLIGSALFLGMACGCLVIPRFADIYGRRRIILACQLLMLPILFSFYFMKTALGAEVRFFLSGFGLAGFIFVNFMYFMEFLLKRHRVNIWTID